MVSEYALKAAVNLTPPNIRKLEWIHRERHVTTVFLSSCLFKTIFLQPWYSKNSLAESEALALYFLKFPENAAPFLSSFTCPWEIKRQSKPLLLPNYSRVSQEALWIFSPFSLKQAVLLEYISELIVPGQFYQETPSLCRLSLGFISGKFSWIVILNISSDPLFWYPCSGIPTGHALHVFHFNYVPVTFFTFLYFFLLCSWLFSCFSLMPLIKSQFKCILPWVLSFSFCFWYDFVFFFYIS